MLVLPVGGAGLDRSTRVEPLDRQRFQLFYGLLIGLNQPLEISLYAESLSRSSGADFSFELWVYRNTHSRTILLTLILILRPAQQTFLSESRVRHAGTSGHPRTDDSTLQRSAQVCPCI